jgi:hypothetical protein
MMPLSCRLSSAIATFGRNRSFSSQISPDQVRLRRPKGAHRDPSRNRSAQIKAYSVDCHLPQPRWQKSALLVTDQPRSRHTVQVVVSPVQGSPPRSFPRRVMPRRSQAEAGHIVMRHFFHWPGHIARRECQGQASTVAVTKGGTAVRVVMVRRREEGSELS